MFRWFALAVAASCFGAGCGPTEAADRARRSSHVEAHLPIVGGGPAAPHQLYATVALVPLGGPFEPFCTGTLVADDVVVTAAHCVVFYDGVDLVEIEAADLLVTAGALTPASSATEQRHRIALVAPHDGYDPAAPLGAIGRANDIAVLVLYETVTTESPAPLLPMADFDAWVQAETSIVISGYGHRDEAATDPEQLGDLYIAETPYQVRSELEYIAGNPDSPDSCLGDSGGPGYVAIAGQLALIGASSRASQPGVLPCGMGGISTLVPAYEPWLIERTGGLYEPLLLERGVGGAAGAGGGPPPKAGLTRGDEEDGCAVAARAPSRGPIPLPLGLTFCAALSWAVRRRHAKPRPEDRGHARGCSPPPEVIARRPSCLLVDSDMELAARKKRAQG